MEMVWLQQYPKGMPAEVDVRAYGSLVDLLRHSCERFAKLPAYSSMGVVMHYAELDRASQDFATYLRQALGLQQGDRVAIMLPNLLQYPVALFGILRAGLVVVNVNPQYTASELAHQLRDSGAAAIVILENFAHTLQVVMDGDPALRPVVITTEVGDLFPLVREFMTNLVVKYVRHLVPAWHIPGAVGFNAALRMGHALSHQEVPLTLEDTAFLQYTGGTTGVAKGAVLTHGNLVANLQQLGAWIAQDLQDGREVLVCPLPLYHVFALTSSLVFMKIGAHTVLVANPRDMHELTQAMRQQRFSALIGVNTLYRALLDAPEFATVDTSGLKVASAGGMAVQRVVAERWQRATGTAIVEGYGLTETSPVVMSNRLDTAEWSGAIGLPLPSTLAVILDDQGRELPVGEVGEIGVRGPQVMRCYWNRPDETAAVFTPEGWLRTGDLGYMDERGYFWMTDRKKDMIVVSGFKVYPNQIEDVVALHPGVAEVAAVGVPDEKSGEAVKVVVVKKDPTLSEAALIAHCRAHLTGYKVPQRVEFTPGPLPKTHLGKILRRELRQAAPKAAELSGAPQPADA